MHPFWGAEARPDDRSQPLEGPSGDEEGRRRAGQLQSRRRWDDVRAPMGRSLHLLCGCLSYSLWLCELIKGRNGDRLGRNTLRASLFQELGAS